MAPFNRPNVIESMIKSPTAWSTYINDSDNIANPVLPMTLDPEESREQKKTSKVPSKASSPSKGKQIKPPSEPSEVQPVDYDQIFSADDSEEEEEKKDGSQSDEEGEAEELEDEVEEIEEDDEENSFGHSSNIHESPLHSVLGDEDGPRRKKKKEESSEEGGAYAGGVTGVEEYTEFQIGSEVYAQDMRRKQQKLKDKILRFCVLRVFRPDLVLSTIREFITILLDESFALPPDFSFNEVFRNTSAGAANLLITGANVDTHSELMTMRKVIKRDHTSVHYMPLGVQNLI